MISSLAIVAPLADLVLLRIIRPQDIIIILQILLAEISCAQLRIPASLPRSHHVDTTPGSRSQRAKIA